MIGNMEQPKFTIGVNLGCSMLPIMFGAYIDELLQQEINWMGNFRDSEHPIIFSRHVFVLLIINMRVYAFHSSW